jgi:hypothetical protein
MAFIKIPFKCSKLIVNKVIINYFENSYNYQFRQIYILMILKVIPLN